MQSEKHQFSFPLIVGITICILGVILNEFFLAKLFSNRPDISSIAKLVIRIFNAACLILGVLLIYFRKNKQVINFSKNLMAAFIPLFLLYLLFEISFKFFIPYLPLSLQIPLDDSFRIISQSSKAEAVPKNYIAILGDSYAMGAGDWYLNSDPQTNPPYNSAHLIQKSLNHDVITFGKGGASSISGLIEQPFNSLRKLRTRYEIDDPKVLLVYFYEGNDLSDNVRDLNLRKPNYFKYSGLDTLNYAKFCDYINNNVISKPSFENISTRILGLKFLKQLTSNYMMGITKDPIKSDGFNNDKDYNVVKFRDSTKQLPDRLQSPSLELSDNEVNLGLKLFSYSLNFLSKKLPDSEIYVVYIPSVLSCYDLAGSVSVQAVEDRNEIYSESDLYQRSDYINSEIAKICLKNKVNFIDTKSNIREYSNTTLLHGPRDWKHFNRIGYEVLASLISVEMGLIL